MSYCCVSIRGHMSTLHCSPGFELQLKPNPPSIYVQIALTRSPMGMEGPSLSQAATQGSSPIALQCRRIPTGVVLWESAKNIPQFHGPTLSSRQSSFPTLHHKHRTKAPTFWDGTRKSGIGIVGLSNVDAGAPGFRNS